ncbi:MAG: hypothetical protein ACFB4I_04935 [Cyanophyceae cyanobacterium]
MKADSITATLEQYFGSNTVQTPSADSWQVEKDGLRLLVILSEDQTWLRLLVPIVTAAEAQPYFQQLLQANFDQTQEVRYALNQGIVWGVFQHSCASLTSEDFTGAIARLIVLSENGLGEAFNLQTEQRIKQIIIAAKLQGQSLESTLQNLTRFYEEGMLGGIDQDAQEREQFLQAWEAQLKRFWLEVEPPEL